MKYENLCAVKDVFDHTNRIFWGTREHTDGGWCYVGRPESWTIKPGCIVPFPSDKVFAVYVNERRILFEYGAEPADPDDPLSPIDWKERYRGKIWPSTF